MVLDFSTDHEGSKQKRAKTTDGLKIVEAAENHAKGKRRCFDYTTVCTVDYLYYLALCLQYMHLVVDCVFSGYGGYIFRIIHDSPMSCLLLLIHVFLLAMVVHSSETWQFDRTSQSTPTPLTTYSLQDCSLKV